MKTINNLIDSENFFSGFLASKRQNTKSTSAVGCLACILANRVIAKVTFKCKRTRTTFVIA